MTSPDPSYAEAFAGRVGAACGFELDRGSGPESLFELVGERREGYSGVRVEDGFELRRLLRGETKAVFSASHLDDLLRLVAVMIGWCSNDLVPHRRHLPSRFQFARSGSHAGVEVRWEDGAGGERVVRMPGPGDAAGTDLAFELSAWALKDLDEIAGLVEEAERRRRTREPGEVRTRLESELRIALGPDGVACLELRFPSGGGKPFSLMSAECHVDDGPRMAAILSSWVDGEVNPPRAGFGTRTAVTHRHVREIEFPASEVLDGSTSADRLAASLPPALRGFFHRTRSDARERLSDGTLVAHMRSYLGVLRTVDDPDDRHGWKARVADIPFRPTAEADWMLIAEDTRAGDLLAEIRREREDIYQWDMDIAHYGLPYPRSQRRRGRSGA